MKNDVGGLIVATACAFFYIGYLVSRFANGNAHDFGLVDVLGIGALSLYVYLMYSNKTVLFQ